MAKVMVIYHSDTGNTEKLAGCVAEGARSVADTQVQLVRAEELDRDSAAQADGLAIGSPDYFSYVAGQIKTFFDKTLYDERFHGKAYVGFGTHGGGAKVLGVLDRLAESCKLNRVTSGLMIQGRPEGDHEDQARRLGKELAEAVG